MAYKIEDFNKWYLDAGKDIKNVDNIKCFDKLRIETYKEIYDTADKEKDPAKKHEALFNLYNRLKQEIAYFIGAEGIKPTGKLSNIQENTTNGLRALEEALK